MTENGVGRTATNHWLGWRRSWAAFVRALLDPLAVVLVLATGGMVIVSTWAVPAGWVQLVMSTLASTFAGLAGARWAQQFAAEHEQSKFKMRGDVAVRSLGVLLSGVMSLRMRMDERADLMSEEDRDVVVEWEHTCTLLAQETAAAIDNWQDITGLADVSPAVKALEVLQQQADATNAKVQALIIALADTEKKGAKATEEKAALKGQLESAQKDLEELRSKQQAQTGVVSISSLLKSRGAMCLNCGDVDFFRLDETKCSKCGKNPGVAGSGLFSGGLFSGHEFK